MTNTEWELFKAYFKLLEQLENEEKEGKSNE